MLDCGKRYKVSQILLIFPYGVTIKHLDTSRFRFRSESAKKSHAMGWKGKETGAELMHRRWKMQTSLLCRFVSDQEGNSPRV